MKPDLKIMLLAETADEDLIVNGIRAGATGCVLREAYPAEVISGILELSRGGTPLSGEVAQCIVHYLQQASYRTEESPSYSKREHEILIQLSKGYQYKEIADSLSISIPTVRTHLRNIYKKLNVRSRTEAVVKFLSKRLS
jgi:DNA-binding NarL/FixJ family response regulator